MGAIDRWTERSARMLARRSSRRGFLARAGALLIGAGVAPLLPVSRAGAAAKDDGDPTRCDYWRYCAIDGFLCSCCGGSTSTCPPGTVASAITWVGTCRNPNDGKDYIISYNDCCGRSGCGRCTCQRDEGDRPLYRTDTANDINWCAGSGADIVYNCSTAVLMGVATGE
ncbi:MAG: methylamine dehydrogenase light chain [Parvibaculum sp.]|uniref:methylamine dehydrogenase light chain n=1 Tax=Parvibaculum sp. TaxID=2024848 RepID=UPI003C716B7A